MSLMQPATSPLQSVAKVRRSVSLDVYFSASQAGLSYSVLHQSSGTRKGQGDWIIPIRTYR